MALVNRRNAILEAAVDLFAENGFSATPTMAIAKRADVAEGLIFHYFKNKKGILMHILDDIYALYARELENILDRPVSGLRMIEEMTICHFALRERKKREFQVLVRDIPSGIMNPDTPEYKKITRHINHLMDVFRQAILRGQNDGSIRSSSPDEMTLVIRGALLGISNLSQRLCREPDYGRLSTAVTAFIRRGIDSGTEDSE
ncbi:MAG: TetR/AcrR family transcriptional regulator [Desulfobacterales bacterium]